MSNKNKEFKEFTTKALWTLAAKGETAADLPASERAEIVAKLHAIIHTLENNPKQVLSCVVFYAKNEGDALRSERIVIASYASLAAHYVDFEDQGKEAFLSCASAVFAIFTESVTKGDKTKNSS